MEDGNLPNLLFKISFFFSQKIKIKIDINNNNILTDVTIHINNTVSMIDTKMVSILQGDSGSPCHYCNCSVAEINNLIYIMKGFIITKSFESCMNTWKSVESGDITWSNTQRFGQCHKPLVEVNFFSILHWK